MTTVLTLLVLACLATLAVAQPVRLRVGFSEPDGTWDMPALALGQGGLQSDPMIEPHIKEVRQLRPRTIRLFLSEYYRIYPDHGTYDWARLDRELQAVRATGARPALALAMKPPVLYPVVDHFIVEPNNYEEWERLCEALAAHCREQGFQVAAWEVCNEPDIGESGGTPHFFRSAEEYNRFYTHTRMHSALGYTAPVEFEVAQCSNHVLRNEANSNTAEAEGPAQQAQNEPPGHGNTVLANSPRPPISDP